MILNTSKTIFMEINYDIKGVSYKGLFYNIRFYNKK